MNDFDPYDDDAPILTADQTDALDQLHGWITHEIAESHLTNDKERSEKLFGQRRSVSAGMSAAGPEGEVADAGYFGYSPDDREVLADRRAALTRELHEAVAQKDSYRAGRLDRERNELTEDLYGNGAIVGAGGRAL